MFTLHSLSRCKDTSTTKQEHVTSNHTQLSGGGVIKGGSVRILSEFLDVRKWLMQKIIISYTYVGY